MTRWLLVLGWVASAAAQTVIRAPQGNKQAEMFPFGGGGGALGDVVVVFPGEDIQSALQGGNVNVYLPCGTYVLNDTLLVDDHTELWGSGDCTILQRANITTLSPAFTNCTPDPNTENRDVIRNRNNDCGTTDLHFHDFLIDGSLLVNPPVFPTFGFRSELGFHLGAATDVTIERVTLRNMPQDGIYFRNGYHNRVDNVLIDGHNLQWGNGSGVNYETHVDANNPSDDPLIVTRTTVIENQPSFCSTDLSIKCDSDGPCGAGTCIGGGNAISANAIDNGAQPPSLIATENTVRLSNYHTAIKADFARKVIIADNSIYLVATRAGGLTGQEKRGRCINVVYTASGTRPTNRNLVIARNLCVGDASVASGTFGFVTRQQGGILVQGDSSTTDQVDVNHNQIRDFNFTGNTNEAGIWIGGLVGGTVTDNSVENITAGAAAYRLGTSTDPLVNVTMAGNVARSITTSEAFQLQNVTLSTFSEPKTSSIGTKYQFLSTNSVALRDPEGLAFADLPAIAAVTTGSRVHCTDCMYDETSGQCLAFGVGPAGQEASKADAAAGDWRCNRTGRQVTMPHLQAWTWQISDTAATLVAAGIAAPVENTPGAAKTTNISSHGALAQYTTSNVANSFAGWTPAGGTYTGVQLRIRPWYAVEMRTGASIASVRYWMGLFSGDPSASSTPALHYIAIRYDDSLDGTTWRRCTDAATGTPTCVDTGITVAVDTRYDFKIDFAHLRQDNGAANNPAVYGRAYSSGLPAIGQGWGFLQFLGLFQTNLPTNTQDLHAVAIVATRAAAQKTIALGRVTVGLTN